MADETLAQDRLVDDAERRTRAVMQRDQGAPGVTAGDEGARAVYGIENPGESARARFVAVLFAQNTVAGPLGADEIAHRRLRAAVGFRDGIEHRLGTCRALVDDLDALAEIGAHHARGRVGKAVGEGDGVPVERHAANPWAARYSGRRLIGRGSK